jgi:hypothetical protein
MSRLDSDKLKTQAAILLYGSVHAAQKAAEEAQQQAAKVPGPEDEQARVDRILREAAAAHARKRKPQAEREASPDTSNHGASASDTQAGYKCAWTLRGGGDDPEELRDMFRHLARDAMKTFGKKFENSDQAVDAWLDCVLEYRNARNNRQGWDDWQLRRLSNESIGCCNKLAKRFYETGDHESEDAFKRLARQFRELPEPARELYAIRYAGTGLEALASPGTTSPLEIRPPRKPGRPEIPDEQKKRALQVKGGKARAKILYAIPYPTPQQIKNTYSIMKYYETHKGGPNKS